MYSRRLVSPVSNTLNKIIFYSFGFSFGLAAVRENFRSFRPNVSNQYSTRDSYKNHDYDDELF